MFRGDAEEKGDKEIGEDREIQDPIPLSLCIPTSPLFLCDPEVIFVLYNFVSYLGHTRILTEFICV